MEYKDSTKGSHGPILCEKDTFTQAVRSTFGKKDYYIKRGKPREKTETQGTTASTHSRKLNTGKRPTGTAPVEAIGTHLPPANASLKVWQDRENAPYPDCGEKEEKSEEGGAEDTNMPNSGLSRSLRNKQEVRKNTVLGIQKRANVGVLRGGVRTGRTEFSKRQ